MPLSTHSSGLVRQKFDTCRVPTHLYKWRDKSLGIKHTDEFVIQTSVETVTIYTYPIFQKISDSFLPYRYTTVRNKSDVYDALGGLNDYDV